MNADGIDWVPVYSASTEIGVVGFDNDRAAIVVSFFDDRDFNRDGKVSNGEKLLSIVGHFLPVPKPNSAMSLVLYVASLDPNIINRDIAFAQYANTRFWNDVGMELKNSAYKIYVANSIKQAAGVISVCAGGGDFVKGFLIKIGCESIMDKIAKNYF